MRLVLVVEFAVRDLFDVLGKFEVAFIPVEVENYHGKFWIVCAIIEIVS